MNRPESSNTAPMIVVGVFAILGLVVFICCGGMLFGFSPLGIIEYVRSIF